MILETQLIPANSQNRTRRGLRYDVRFLRANNHPFSYILKDQGDWNALPYNVVTVPILNESRDAYRKLYKHINTYTPVRTCEYLYST